MATEVIMPKLGLTMEKGTIGAWLVAEGDAVEKGAPLLEVITDKVTMEVEAQAAGLLRKILVPAGEEVPVSTPIGIIAGADEKIDLPAEPAASVDAGQAATATAQPVASKPEQVAVAPTPAATKEGRPHRASPKARKIAAEKGIDLSQVQGSGPGGRIVSADLANVVAAAPAAPAPRPQASADAPRQLLTRPQQVAAQRLTESYQQSPHIHLSMEVAAVWMQQFRQGYRLEGKRVSYNDLIVKAVGRALGDFSRLNSVFDGDAIVVQPRIDIGIAVDTPQGLMVPVIRDVPAKTAPQIAEEAARLAVVAREGRLAPDDMSGGTFTISNLGMFGISRFTAIINPPQVAILAVGAVEKRVVALEDDAMAVRPMCTLTLAADHRVIDGAVGARFLARLKEILETPGLLG